jgi:hypothetical protein
VKSGTLDSFLSRNAPHPHKVENWAVVKHCVDSDWPAHQEDHPCSRTSNLPIGTDEDTILQVAPVAGYPGELKGIGGRQGHYGEGTQFV